MSSSVSISISIPTFNSIPNSISTFISGSVLPHFSLNRPITRRQLQFAKEAALNCNCGQSRHCDHMKRVATDR